MDTWNTCMDTWKTFSFPNIYIEIANVLIFITITAQNFENYKGKISAYWIHAHSSSI